MKTTARRSKKIQPEQQAIVTVPSVEVHEPAFDPTWQHQPSAENSGDGEAIAPLDAQLIVEEKTEGLTGQKQGSKKTKPPKLPDWAIGTRVTCQQYGTFARVEHRISNRIALRWEHGDKGGGTFTAEDLRDMRIVRAAVQNPEVEAIVGDIDQTLADEVADEYPAPTHKLETSPVEVLDLTESDRLIESLYQQLQEAEAEANAAFKNATSKYFELGIELLKRRPEFPRGTWLAWLAERGINEKYAQRAMQIGSHFGEKSDSLSGMSIENALRQIQKKLPSVDGYTFEEVKAEYESIVPNCFKFHRGAAHPYSFEVQGFSSYFSSLSQAMERLPTLREKYGRIAQYQSVDDVPEEGALIAPQPETPIVSTQPAYQVGDRLTSKSGDAEVVAIDGDTLVLNQQQENGVTSSRVPIAKADKNWQPVSEERLTGTDAQTLKDLCEYHGLRKVAIAVLLSATLDQLDEIGNWIAERQLQLE